MPPLIVIVIAVCIAISLGIASYRLAAARQSVTLAIENLEIEPELGLAAALEVVPAVPAPYEFATQTAERESARIAERVGMRLVIGLALALSLAAFFDSLAPRSPRAEDAACRR